MSQSVVAIESLTGQTDGSVAKLTLASASQHRKGERISMSVEMPDGSLRSMSYEVKRVSGKFVWIGGAGN